MRIICIGLFFCISYFCEAQFAVISGRITDLEGRTAIGVIITQKGQSDIGTATDESGKFNLRVIAGEVTLVFKGIGAEIMERNFPLKEGEEKYVDLTYDNSAKSQEIIIRAEREAGLKRVETKLATKLPTINPGIESYLLQMPVNFASELSSSYSVRGGSFDENLVYVNGIQVHRPFLVRAGEQEGLSFPNPDMVSNILFSAGGFSARYGDRMSSVLDVQYSKPDSTVGNVTMGALGASFHLGGRSKDKRFSHNTGIRYKNNAYIFNSLDVAGDYRPRYYDIQTYLTWQPQKYSPWEFSFLGNYQNNRYQFIPSTRTTDVGTINEALRLTVFFEGQEITAFETFFGAFSTKFNPSPTSQVSLTLSAFNTYETERFDIQGAYRLDELERDLGSDEFGEVLRNRGVGGYLDHARNALEATVMNASLRGFITHEGRKNTINWGADFQQDVINDKLAEWSLTDSAGYASPRPPDNLNMPQPMRNIPLNDVIRSENTVLSQRISVFVQDDKKWKWDNGHTLALTAGVRGNHWSFNNQLVGGPRVSAAYTPIWKDTRKNKDGTTDTLFRDMILTAAIGYYFQPPFYREMRNFEGQINPEIQAQQSIHYILGTSYRFNAMGRPFLLNTEMYYKDMRNLIPYEVENVRIRYLAKNNARGYSYGADCMLNGELIKGVQSWVRLSYLKTEEDLRDDFYYIYLNQDGDTIYGGFTIDNVAVDSIRVTPGFIPRPNDQRVSFSMVFQDEMPRKPWYKVLVTAYFATGVPFGPPLGERYLDVSRSRSYIRTDIGFSRDLILPGKKNKNWFNRTFDSGYIALEVFNLLGNNNIINHQWVEDVNGRQYGIPTYLTGRRVNLRVSLSF
jgi:hypothetical protein